MYINFYFMAETNNVIELTKYDVILFGENWSETKYYGIDKDDAIDIYNGLDSRDVEKGSNLGASLRSRKDIYKFVYNISEEEQIEDYPIEDYYENSDFYELIKEGDMEDIEYKDIESLESLKTKEEKIRFEDINTQAKEYIISISKEYKVASFLGSTFYALVPYLDGFIQVRIADHFFNLSNINLGRSIIWDNYEHIRPEFTERRDIYGFLSINIIDSNTDYYNDRRGNKSEYKYRKESSKYPDLIKSLTYDVYDERDYESFDVLNDIKQAISDIKMEIDEVMAKELFDKKEEDGNYEPLEYKKGGEIKTNNGLKGGLLKGDKHSDPSGGIEAVVVTDNNKPVLLEDKEVIINKKAVQDPTKKTLTGTNKEILNAINTSTGGNPIMEQGGSIMEDGGSIDDSTVSNACIEEVVKLIATIKPIKDWFIEKDKLIIVFKEELFAFEIEQMSFYLEKFTECHDVIHTEALINYGESHKTVMILLKKSNITIGKFNDGGKIDFNKKELKLILQETQSFKVDNDVQLKEIYAYKNGICYLQILYTKNSKKLFQIAGLFVNENIRNNGIGSLAIDFAKNRAKELGFKEITYIVADYNGNEYDNLVSFCKKNGFVFVGNSNKKMIFNNETQKSEKYELGGSVDGVGDVGDVINLGNKKEFEVKYYLTTGKKHTAKTWVCSENRDSAINIVKAEEGDRFKEIIYAKTTGKTGVMSACNIENAEFSEDDNEADNEKQFHDNYRPILWHLTMDEFCQYADNYEVDTRLDGTKARLECKDFYKYAVILPLLHETAERNVFLLAVETNQLPYEKIVEIIKSANAWDENNKFVKQLMEWDGLRNYTANIWLTPKDLYLSSDYFKNNFTKSQAESFYSRQIYKDAILDDKVLHRFLEKGIVTFEDVMARMNERSGSLTSADQRYIDKLKAIADKFKAKLKLKSLYVMLDDELNIKKEVAPNAPKNRFDTGKPFLPPNQQQFLETLLYDIQANVSHNKRSLEKIAQSFGIKEQNTAKELAELSITFVARIYAHEKDLTKKQRYDKIVNLYESQVNMSHRTSESILLQQYSTPAPLGYIMGLYCGVEKDGLYFEPSAGNGLLTIAGEAKNFIVNEIDPIRNRNLQVQGFKEVLKQDASEPFKGFANKFDAVITNPPFGKSEAVKYGNSDIKSLEQVMALRALDTMRDNGRAAIIIGGHQEWDSEGRIVQGKNRIFFVLLNRYYVIEDVINISGRDLYSKQGTSFNVRIILINKTRTNPKLPPLLDEKLGVTENNSGKTVTTFDDLWTRVTRLL